MAYIRRRVSKVKGAVIMGSSPPDIDPFRVEISAISEIIRDKYRVKKLSRGNNLVEFKRYYHLLDYKQYGVQR
jgi:hypothetical protein